MKVIKVIKTDARFGEMIHNSLKKGLTSYSLSLTKQSRELKPNVDSLKGLNLQEAEGLIEDCEEIKSQLKKALSDVQKLTKELEKVG